MEQTFNNATDITVALNTVQQFSEMLVWRSKHKENLDIFIVNGKWYLDQFGQWPRLSFMDSDYLAIPNTHEIFSQLQGVVSYHRFMEICKEYQLSYQISFSADGPLPAQTTCCQKCAKHWQVNNLTDYTTRSFTIEAGELVNIIGKEVFQEFAGYVATQAIIRVNQDEQNAFEEINLLIEEWLEKHNGFKWRVIREADKIIYYQYREYYHTDCMAKVIHKETQDAIINSVYQSGLQFHGLVRTRNRYGSQAYKGNWYLVDTSHGLLRVGWRKRVIEVDYSMIDKDYVPSTEETSGPGFEHVYGYDKLKEALVKFRAYLSDKTNFVVNIPDLISKDQVKVHVTYNSNERW